MTSTATLTCPKCRAELPDQLAPLGTAAPCPRCSRSVEGVVFAAFRRPLAEGKSAEALVAAEDAGCFYHPQSRAQVPCDSCGRFLCALCDVELNDQHLCPACVNSGRKKKQIRQLDNSRILYGGIASLLAFLPLIAFWPATLITAPIAVFIALFGWRKPLSITGAGRSSYVLALFLGLIEIGVWALALSGFFLRT